MCGICGEINTGAAIDREVLTAMTRSLRHRGPDDEGFYFNPLDESPQVGLGFRRLSIIDLSGGHQPMTNEDETLWIVFNGELYNFRELRPQLEARGHQFRTNSDTEVIVHAYEEWGEACVERFNGMFAFTLWDRRRRCLFAARDHFGKKPLYYVQQGQRFLFASELTALWSHPHFEARLDLPALSDYLAFEYVPAPRAILADVRKLPAAHTLTWHEGRVEVRRYWDLCFDEMPARSEADLAEELRQQLRASVQRRLISDVPLGVFLSGGLDSSAVVAMMAELLPPEQIKTFAIGFHDSSFDESAHARTVAAHFHTDHHEQRLEPQTLIDILPQVFDFLDEPLGDASLIPTYLLARFTRQHVTVALGGDGGDELFAGYPTFQAERMARIYQYLPEWLHRMARGGVERMPVSRRNLSFDFKLKQFLAGVRAPMAARHQTWLGSFPPCAQQELLSPELRAQLNRHNPHDRLAEWLPPPSAATHWVNQLSSLYCKSYLQDDILFKVDRATMAASLEARAPFLDRELVEFVTALPPRWKLRGWTTKYLLKRALRGRLPPQILRRGKKGFGIPVARWFRKELQELLHATLEPAKLRREGLFCSTTVGRLLDEHRRGARDHRKPLWTLFVFELWRQRHAGRLNDAVAGGTV